MKKKILFAALAAVAGLAVLPGCAVKLPAAYNVDFRGKDRRQVLIEWCKLYRAMDENNGLPWPIIRTPNPGLESCFVVRLGFGEDGLADESLARCVDACLSSPDPAKDAESWSCFQSRLPDWNQFDFKVPCKRLIVWFDASGVVTNQCVESYFDYGP